MFNLKFVNLDHNEEDDFNHILPTSIHELFHVISFGNSNLANFDSALDSILHP